MTQTRQVLDHLKSGRTLTALQALTDYGIIQLPARIWELRQAGYPVDKEMVSRLNRYGERVHVAEYRLAS